MVLNLWASWCPPCRSEMPLLERTHDRIAGQDGLVLGIDSDRLFPVPDQQVIARGIRSNLDGDDAVVITSDFGHDGFLIEDDVVGAHLERLLAA